MSEYSYYHVIYDTDFGDATFEGYYEDLDVFFEAADKAALEAGLIEQGETIGSCDKVITYGDTLEEVYQIIEEDE